MQRVAASDMWSLGKLMNITCSVFKTSSLIVAVDHNSLSSAAAMQQYNEIIIFNKYKWKNYQHAKIYMWRFIFIEK
jgi:hypothetical protein